MKRSVAKRKPKTGKRVTDISELTPEARECREMGHWWVKSHRHWLKKTPKGKNISEDRELRCERCNTVRTQQFDISPTLGKFIQSAAPRMKYPKGYLMVGRKLSRAEVMYYNYLRSMEGK